MGRQSDQIYICAGCDAADGCSKMHGADFSTRRRRRSAVKRAISQLASIRDAEQKSLDNVPDSLQGTESYEAGELAVDTLDEIIDMLADVY